MQNHELGMDSNKICIVCATKNTPKPNNLFFGSTRIQSIWDIIEKVNCPQSVF